MISQTMLLTQSATPQPQKDQVSSQQIEFLYRNLQNNIQKEPAFKKFRKLSKLTETTAQSLGVGKLISKKMRSKLINWMQKLAIQTFDFSVQTVLMSIKILDQYLCLTNQSPSQLQLIGCSCLFLASKKLEPVQVAGQCYVTASSNCFTQADLFSKETLVFKTLNGKLNFLTLAKMFNFLSHCILSEKVADISNQALKQLFLQCVKSSDLEEFQQVQISCMIFTLIQSQKDTSNRAPTLDNLITNLKKYGFQC